MTRKHAKELLPILQAYAEGKTIQTIMPNGEWRDCEKPSFTYNLSFYRIKPEEDIEVLRKDLLKEAEKHKIWLPKEKHYQPFKDCDELVECYNNRAFTPIVAAGLDTNRNKMFRPNIWVKSKQYGTDNMIIAFDGDNESIGGSCVFIQDIWVDMQELFDNFTFCDGSVCGVEE